MSVCPCKRQAICIYCGARDQGEKGGAEGLGNSPRAKGRLSPALDTLGLRSSGAGLRLPAGYLFIEIISFQLRWVSLTRVIRSS